MTAWLQEFGIERVNPGTFSGEWRSGGPALDCRSPIDGKLVAEVKASSAEDYGLTVARAGEAFLKWRSTPAPVRGETIRRLANALREAKANLARLVTLETGKILVEAEGEVQE